MRRVAGHDSDLTATVGWICEYLTAATRGGVARPVVRDPGPHLVWGQPGQLLRIEVLGATDLLRRLCRRLAVLVRSAVQAVEEFLEVVDEFAEAADDRGQAAQAREEGFEPAGDFRGPGGDEGGDLFDDQWGGEGEGCGFFGGVDDQP
jgi:hypothetical protein